MQRKILVAYATQYGATREIADRVGEELNKAGFQADVREIKHVGNLNDYEAVIIGSGLYIGKWNKDAVEFVKRNEKILASKPLWIFSSGPTGDGDPVQLVDGMRVPPEIQSVVDRISPRSLVVFHGYINPKKLNFIQKWAIKNVVKKPFGDYRDWKMISSWAQNIAADL